MYWIIKKSDSYNGIDIQEIKCSNCGHCETVRPWQRPKECYVCEQKNERPEV